jgi:hypothetical protein
VIPYLGQGLKVDSAIWRRCTQVNSIGGQFPQQLSAMLNSPTVLVPYLQRSNSVTRTHAHAQILCVNMWEQSLASCSSLYLRCCLWQRYLAESTFYVPRMIKYNILLWHYKPIFIEQIICWLNISMNHDSLKSRSISALCVTAPSAEPTWGWRKRSCPEAALEWTCL